MNWLIILAAITLAVYAKAQSCDSTYKENATAINCQYGSTADLCVDECNTSVSNTANSIINNHLPAILNNSAIMNNEAFEIDRNVSLMTASIAK